MLDFWVPSKGNVNLVPSWAVAGAPTSGAAGTLANIAAPGDLLVDTTNKITYQNTGSLASPTWTALPQQGGAINSTFLRVSIASGLTAVGSSRADALVLTAQENIVATAASAAVGVVLPSAAAVGIGGKCRVYNDGPANAFHVYAAGSDTIDGTAGATGKNLTNAFYCDYLVTAANTFVSYRQAITRSA